MVLPLRANVCEGREREGKGERKGPHMRKGYKPKPWGWSAGNREAEGRLWGLRSHLGWKGRLALGSPMCLRGREPEGHRLGCALVTSAPAELL